VPPSFEPHGCRFSVSNIPSHGTGRITYARSAKSRYKDHPPPYWSQTHVPMARALNCAKAFHRADDSRIIIAIEGSRYVRSATVPKLILAIAFSEECHHHRLGCRPGVPATSDCTADPSRSDRIAACQVKQRHGQTGTPAKKIAAAKPHLSSTPRNSETRVGRFCPIKPARRVTILNGRLLPAGYDHSGLQPVLLPPDPCDP